MSDNGWMVGTITVDGKACQGQIKRQGEDRLKIDIENGDLNRGDTFTAFDKTWYVYEAVHKTGGRVLAEADLDPDDNAAPATPATPMSDPYADPE